MPKIFICYRREDSRWPAQLIYNILVGHFGSESVIWDVDTIPIGLDFREYLNEEVGRCDILLALIGDKWLQLLKQRLDNKNDYVCVEIQAALERNIPVVPILVDKALMPTEENLPKALGGLSYRQATVIRTGPDLQVDLKRLTDGLDRLLPDRIASQVLKQPEELEHKESEKKFTNSIGQEFVLIPAGSFMMGSKLSPDELVQKYGGEAEDYKDAYPQHKVTITKPFYLQSTQVTQGQWQEVVGNNPSFFVDCGDDCPVERVSWYDAQEFISKLRNKEGTNKYRLPTEAEWEYACRAGTTTEFSFGDNKDKLGAYAWDIYNSDYKTHHVRQKEPNAWGLYDMHGNVFEWCQDWYGEYPSSSVVDPEGPDKGEHRACRGGAIYLIACHLRSAFRGFYHNPDYRSTSIGFRVARSF